MTRELLDFLCRLEMYKTNVKNIHWSAPTGGLVLHEELDEVLNELSDFQDNVAEDAQSIFGRINVGDVIAIGDMEKDPAELLVKIRADLANMLDILKDKMYTGIVNSIEDYWNKVNIRIYRVKLALGR